MADHFGGVVPQVDAGDSQTKTIYGAVITVTILATIAVILRFMARRKSAASISYEYVFSKSMSPEFRHQAFKCVEGVYIFETSSKTRSHRSANNENEIKRLLDCDSIGEYHLFNPPVVSSQVSDFVVSYFCMASI